MFSRSSSKKLAPWAHRPVSHIASIVQSSCILVPQLGSFLQMETDGVTFLVPVLAPQPPVTSGKFDFGVG